MKNEITSTEKSNKLSALPGPSTQNNNAAGEDQIFLPDECGDSLWDKVLNQEQEVLAQKTQTDSTSTAE